MVFALSGLLFQLQVAMPVTGSAELAGRWRFHAGDDPAWSRPSFDDHGWDSVMVPGRWAPPQTADYQGFGWYRLRVTLSQSPREPLGLWFRSVATAFEVFVDGERLGSIGGFPPDYRPRTVVPLVIALPVEAQSPGSHVIAVRVYSAERIGGITGVVTMGPVQALQRDSLRPDLYLASAAVLVLGIGMMQIFFWVRRSAQEHAAIFAVCACQALFFLWWMPSMRIALEPHVFWFRLYLASAAGCAAAFCAAFRRIFDLDRHDNVILIFTLVFLAQVPAFLLVPGWGPLQQMAVFVLNPTLLIVATVTTGLALLQWRRGAHHARILLLGTLVLTVALFHDILIGWGLLAVRPEFPWLTLIGSVGFAASLALTNAEKFVASETAALYDRLTGLYRREVVMDALAREIRRASRVRQPLAVIMLDVDRFKQINDTLGHQAGDKVLAELGRRMSEAGRAVDWLGRYGGEEFIAILAASDLTGATLAAERLRAAVSALPIATGRTARTVTLSAGIAAYDGGPEWPTTEQLVGAADSALYRAKNAGRNRVMG